MTADLTIHFPTLASVVTWELDHIDSFADAIRVHRMAGPAVRLHPAPDPEPYSAAAVVRMTFSSAKALDAWTADHLKATAALACTVFRNTDRLHTQLHPVPA